MQQTTKHTSIPRLVVSLLVLALTIWIFFHRDYVVDQLTVWQYKPTNTIEAIAERAALNDKGRFLFYASQPRVENRNAFNEHCRKHAEQTAILGCYAGRIIYLYDITDPRLDGIKEVTAAHEMLHAAYTRLSETERNRVDGLIDETARSLKNPSIEKKLALYDQTEPGERLNELHSMLGSEATELPAELETYYAQYFTNRLSLVALSNKYEQVFAELELKQTQLVNELNALAEQINKDNQSYKTRFSQQQEEVASFNQRAENSGFSSQAQFNAERSRLVAQQRELSSFRYVIMASIDSYEAKRAELEALNGTAAGLQDSIDSTSLPEVPSL
ncbi:MAG: hypothetical protein ABIQ64_01520 [Candidatus Saccharimonadales bacterium]